MGSQGKTKREGERERERTRVPRDGKRACRDYPEKVDRARVLSSMTGARKMCVFGHQKGPKSWIKIAPLVSTKGEFENINKL